MKTTGNVLGGSDDSASCRVKTMRNPEHMHFGSLLLEIWEKQKEERSGKDRGVRVFISYM